MSGLASYATHPGTEEDDLIVHHLPLVKRITYHLMSRLPPNVQADDLLQAGMLGLLEAARQYDPSQGASFETYAGIRIRGAILDEIRRNDWTPRSVYRKARVISEAVREVENREGRDARDHEVADALGIPVAEYHQLLQEASGHRLMSFDDICRGGDAVSEPTGAKAQEPYEDVQSEDFKRALAGAIAGLPERERLVMALYYDEELNLREIGEVLGVTESRVSQIHSQAILRLQARMGSWISEI